MKRFLDRNADYFYFAFRVIIGLVFLLHGIMKLPGMFAGTTPVMSLIFLAGIIETVGGAFLILGLFTRSVACISAIEMVFAYFMAHASRGWSPLANNGEPAVLFFAAFLVLAAFGAGRWALDNLKRRR